MQVTRGTAGRSHAFPKPPPQPNELVYVQEIPEDKYQEVRPTGIKVVTCEDTRWKCCHIKSVNLLPNCLAQEAACRVGAEEALFVGNEGYITEGTHTNVFAVQGQTMRTAPLSERILPGVTRAWILDHAAEVGLRIKERPIHVNELPHLSEMFLTGTTVEVLGVSAVDDRPIGDGRSGHYTGLLFQSLRRAIAAMTVHP